MMDGILAYIRSWFPTNPTKEVTRKRRALDNYPEFASRKYRKVLSPMSNNIDDNLFTLGLPRRRSLDPPCIVIDDDKSPRYLHRTSKLNTSKPRNSTENKSKLQNDNDDVTYIRTIPSTTEKRLAAKKGNYEYITTFSPLYEPSSASKMRNGTRPKISPIPKAGRTPVTSSPALDYSIRLEEKKKYREMLESLINNSPNNNASVYSTPVGKLYNTRFNHPNITRRGKRLVELAKFPSKEKSLEVIDLTNETNNKTRLSTKDTVMKVLDDFETNVIEDSDSDVEILPNPPSPKPDIKVDPVNSLKTVVDTSEVSKPKWLDDFSESYDRFVKNKAKEAEVYSENSSTLYEINQQLLIKSLTKRINESLAFKDSILPVEEEEKEIELPSLTDAHFRLVKRGLSGDPNEVLTKKFNLNVTRRDMQTLSGLNWLNDNVINFYMNLIIERGKEDKWPSAYCMNTFFFQKLMTSGPESLRRWTRRVDIFAHHFICVPIHLGMHWCMAIIDLKERSIRYFDSMGKPNNQCLLALKKYLEYEHKDKKGQPFDASDFVLENMQDIPQQMNGSDCGMFACTFAEFATRRARFTFHQQDMPYLRKKMVVEIMEGHLLIQ